MVELSARSACAGLLPLKVGTLTLTELMPEAITSVAPQQGQENSVSTALSKAHGLAFPAPNRATGTDDLRCIWTGPGQAFLLGSAVKPIMGAAMTDQTDGWAVIRLQGAACEAVLARLVPVDLRAATFKIGHTARCMLFHAPASVTRSGAAQFDLLIFRSMAKTVIEELNQAMKSIAAQSR